MSNDEAIAMYHSVRNYSEAGYSDIRSAYRNPEAAPEDLAALTALDNYVNGAPKWDGCVCRGINVSRQTAKQILSGETIDMLGPSSWSSDRSVAERFSKGKEAVSMLFILDDNKSGVSITHLGYYNGAESEVLAPSGIQYSVLNVEHIRQGFFKETIIVHVAE